MVWKTVRDLPRNAGIPPVRENGGRRESRVSAGGSVATRGVDSAGYTEAASLSSLRVLVDSRYSWTQRSITAAVFSTLVN